MSMRDYVRGFTDALDYVLALFNKLKSSSCMFELLNQPFFSLLRSGFSFAHRLLRGSKAYSLQGA